MINQTPFRKQALASLTQREQLDHLLEVTAPNERIFISGIGVIVFAILLWMIFGSVTHTVVTGGIVAGAHHTIIPDADGHMESWLVEEGDLVETGDPIAQLALPRLDARISALRDRVQALANSSAGSDGDGGRMALLVAAQLALLEVETDRAVMGTVISPATGEVVEIVAPPGTSVTAGDEIAVMRVSGQSGLQVLAQFAGRVPEEIVPGVPATVTITLPGGSQQFLSAVVVEIATPRTNLPEQRGSLGAAGSVSQVHLASDCCTDLEIRDGTPASVKFMLERRSPAEFLGLTRR